MFDCHLHTDFSTDSKMLLEEAMSCMDQLGIGLITTEHMDLKFPVPGSFIFDVDEYFKRYSEYRGDNLLLGIEMGLRLDCFEENKEVIKDRDFDYVLGSVHLVNGVDIYDESYYKDKTKKAAYTEYFQYMLDCIRKYQFIDSLGHIDYIARYARYDNRQIYYGDYTELIDEILNTLIRNNTQLELNTRRLDNKETIDELMPIYKRYQDLGGEYITIGSDAHNPADIGRNFNVAEAFAESCALKIVHFKERKLCVSK